jgi:hypothetical protein
MANGKAGNSNTIVDELLKFKKERAKGFGIGRQNFSGIGSTVAIGGAGSKGSPSVTGGEAYLKTGGDTMIGPIAYYPKAATIAAGVLDVGVESSGFSTRVVVSGEGAADDDLVTIANVAHAGQMLFLQPILTNTITLKHGVDNIHNPGGVDVVVAGGETIILQWDTVVNANKWVVLTGSTGSGGGDNLGNHTATEALDMATFNIANVDTILFTNPVTTISSISSGMEFRIGDTKDYSLWMNSVEEFTFNQTELDVKDNNIIGINNLFFTDPHSVTADASGLTYDADDGVTDGYHIFTAQGGTKRILDLNLIADEIETYMDIIPDVASDINLGGSGTDEEFDAVYAHWFSPITKPHTTGRQGIRREGDHVYADFPATVTGSFDIRENGLGPLGVTTSGSDPWFRFDVTASAAQFTIFSTLVAGQDPQIKFGQGVDSATITYANGDDLVIDTATGSPTRGLDLQVGGFAGIGIRSDKIYNNLVTDMQSNDIVECKNILTDGDVTNRTVGSSGASNGFDFYVRNGIFRDANPATKINFDSTGLHLETNSTSDDIDITTVGLTSDITLTATGDVLIKSAADTLIGTAALPTMIQVDATGVFFNSTKVTFNVDIDLGTNWIDINDITAPANPAVGVRRLFTDTATGELSVRTNGGTTISLEGAGGGSAPFDDDTAIVQDSVDNTKQVQIEAVGIKTGTTSIIGFNTQTTGNRSYTFPDVSGTIALLSSNNTWTQPNTFNGTVTFGGGIVDFNSHIDLVAGSEIRFNNSGADEPRMRFTTTTTPDELQINLDQLENFGIYENSFADQILLVGENQFRYVSGANETTIPSIEWTADLLEVGSENKDTPHRMTMRLVGNETTPLSNQVAAEIEFMGEDSASQDEDWGSIFGSRNNVTANDEEGILGMQVRTGSLGGRSTGIQLEGRDATSGTNTRLGFFGVGVNAGKFNGLTTPTADLTYNSTERDMLQDLWDMAVALGFMDES